MQALSPVGQVTEIAGSGSQIRMDAAALNALQSHADTSVAMSGQVGSQVKMIVGNDWLIANVRTLRATEGSEIVAHVDFLGEGTQGSRAAGSPTSAAASRVTRSRAARFTRLRPTTFAAVFAASDEPHIEIGTVYPTDDIRGALYVDSMLVEALRGAGIDRYR